MAKRYASITLLVEVEDWSAEEIVRDAGGVMEGLPVGTEIEEPDELELADQLSSILSAASAPLDSRQNMELLAGSGLFVHTRVLVSSGSWAPTAEEGED